MKIRKISDIIKVLQKKGFILNPAKQHHDFYFLHVNGKKHTIHTYFSHGSKEYGNTLMPRIKKQLKFRNTKKAEDFFDCPLSAEGYINMLKENGDL